MNLYSYDFGWEGAIAVVAESPEEALMLMGVKVQAHEIRPEELDVHEIAVGTVVDFMGDMRW